MTGGVPSGKSAPILNVVKDFTMPSARTKVPYMVMGAGINFYRGLDGRHGCDVWWTRIGSWIQGPAQ